MRIGMVGKVLRFRKRGRSSTTDESRRSGCTITKESIVVRVARMAVRHTMGVIVRTWVS